MPTIDQQFVEYIIKTLVNNPDKVSVERTTDERGVLLTLTVDPTDIGRVIGKGGSTAQSLRTLLRALGTKNQARYNLKITDGESSEEMSIPQAATEAVPQTEEANQDIAEDAQDDSDNDFAEKTRAEMAEFDDIDV